MTSEAWLLVGAATFIGAVIQSATGMGFALVAAPVFVSVLSPTTAVAVLLALTAANNVTALVTSRARAIHWPLVRRVLPASVVGLPVGVWVLTLLPTAVLQVVIGGCVVAWVGWIGTRRLRAGRGQTEPGQAIVTPASSWAGDVLVGFACGVLTTTSGLNGPPLAAWFQRYLPSAARVKDSLQASFLFLTLVGLCVMATTSDLRVRVVATPVLFGVGFMLVGASTGHRLSRRMSDDHFRVCLNVVVLSAGVASLVGGVVAL